MAKDDYDVVVFRILVYLYAIFKGKQIFDQHIFLKVISKVEEDYLYRVLEMMRSKSLIRITTPPHAFRNCNPSIKPSDRIISKTRYR